MKHTRLISDGDQFFEVPTRPSSPSSFDSSLDAEMDVTSSSPVATAPTPTHPLPNLATTASSTAPAAVASDPSTHSPVLSTFTTGTGGPQLPISQDAARAIIVAYILASAWFEADEMEPRADQEGVPECALLLANPGDSIWACFFKRTRRNGATIYKCAGCQHKTARLNRAVDHQRAKWEHKPFACTDSGWYVAGSTVVICFFDHWTLISGITPVSSVVPRVVVLPTIVVQGLGQPHVKSGAYLQYFQDGTYF